MTIRRSNGGRVDPSLVELSVPDAVLRGAPQLVRFAATAWWRVTEWSLASYLRVGGRVMRAAINGDSPAELLQETRDELRDYGRRLLGVADMESRLWRVIAPEAAAFGAPPAIGAEDGTAAALRERGAELLRRSADVDFAENTHPAYARILGEMAPDEARILRFLAQEGPQPSVDVRTSRPLNAGSQLVGPGLSMIGVHAGCRRLEQVPAYLNNLYRLGLIWFSRDPVTDAHRYQVLEVQPDVTEAKRRAGRARVIRRSITLTPFGTDFCAMCFTGGAPAGED
jgi:hypothetical protein